jgi:hypothetical protein
MLILYVINDKSIYQLKVTVLLLIYPFDVPKIRKIRKVRYSLTYYTN